MTDAFLLKLAENIPEGFVRAVPAMIDHAYRQAHEEVGANPLVDVLERAAYEGYTRYVYLAAESRRVAAEHGMRVVVMTTGSYSFTALIAGTVAVTVNKVGDSGLPPADYREWLAAFNRASEQPMIDFDGVTSVDALAGVDAYAILFHRRDPGEPCPAMIGFGMPLHDDATVFAASVSIERLLQVFTDRAANRQRDEEPNDRVRPRIRRRIREGDAG